MRVSDQLSRYDAQHDPSRYDVRARSRILTSEEIEAIRVSKDTLNSPEKIKRESLTRLTYTVRVIEGNLIASILMSVLKNLFIVVVWPPYTIVYAIPKWVCTMALPKAIEVIKETVNALQKTFVKALVNPVVAASIAIVKAIQSVAVALVVQPLRRLAIAVKKGIQKGMARTKLGVLKAPKSVKKAALSFVKRIRSLPEKLIASIRAKVAEQVERITAPFKAAKGKIQAAMKMTRKWIQNVPSHWMQQMAERVATSTPGWIAHPVQQLIGKFDTAQRLAEQATQWLSLLVASKVVSPISGATERFHGALKRAIAKGLSRLKRAGSFFGGRGRQLFHWVQSKKKKISKNTREGVRAVALVLFSLLPTPLQRFLMRIMQHRWVLSALKTADQALVRMVSAIARLPKIVKNRSLEIMRDGIKAVKSAAKACSDALSRGVTLIARLLNRTVYWTLSLAIMSAIIAGWSTQLLARVTMRLSQRVWRQKRA